MNKQRYLTNILSAISDFERNPHNSNAINRLRRYSRDISPTPDNYLSFWKLQALLVCLSFEKDYVELLKLKKIVLNIIDYSENRDFLLLRLYKAFIIDIYLTIVKNFEDSDELLDQLIIESHPSLMKSLQVLRSHNNKDNFLIHAISSEKLVKTISQIELLYDGCLSYDSLNANSQAIHNNKEIINETQVLNNKIDAVLSQRSQPHGHHRLNLVSSPLLKAYQTV